MLLPTDCGEIAGSFSLGVTGRLDLGYAASDDDPAMGLTRDSHDCDLNHRLAVFEPSFGGALFVSPLDPLFVIPFWI